MTVEPGLRIERWKLKKYILFDNDGVLVDTEPFYFLAGQASAGDLDVHGIAQGSGRRPHIW